MKAIAMIKSIWRQDYFNKKSPITGIGLFDLGNFFLALDF